MTCGKPLALLRPQVHVDTHEIAAIGDLAEIDHCTVAGCEDTTDFGHGRVEGHAQQPRRLEIRGADGQRLTGAGDRGIPESLRIGITVSLRKRFGDLRKIFSSR